MKVVHYIPLRHRWITSVGSILTVIILFIAVAALFGIQSRNYNQPSLTPFAATSNPNNAINFDVLITDIVLGGNVYLELAPVGANFGKNVKYGADITKTYGLDFKVAVNGATATLTNGSLLSSLSFSARLIDNRQLYPFDSYSVNLAIQAYEGATVLDNTLDLSLNCSTQTVGSYSIQWDGLRTPEGSTGVRLLRAVITRTGLARVYPVFLIVAFWVVAIAMGFVTLALTLWRYRPVDADYLSMSAGLIFALPALRQTAPDSTDIGTLMDYIAFYWAMLTSVLVFLACLVRYVTQGWPELHMHLEGSGMSVLRHGFATEDFPSLRPRQSRENVVAPAASDDKPPADSDL
eukprot:TRINITY_DN942_c0_g6_i2.p1 TRINITY_DN942_c0_g6~~TRINITY_DN942_c0_g6_i2.p1  ORF type:complete len:349 (-),score=36.33 TRINITY_DN942_c0_g6_i2:21-1067(-)